MNKDRSTHAAETVDASKGEDEEEEEEEDYMSDAFLAVCQKTDVRPGLKRRGHGMLANDSLHVSPLWHRRYSPNGNFLLPLQSHVLQREHDLQKKKSLLLEQERQRKRQKKTLKQLEEEKREEGLGKSLDETNKGFAMLQRMGYKQGQGLGKEQNGGISGRLEPVPVNVKTGRGGLGRDAILKEIAERKQTIVRRRRAEQKDRTQINADEYRAHISRQRRQQRQESDLYQSQKVCEQLDQAKGIEAAAERWFWPRRPPTEAEDVDEDVEEEEEEEEEALEVEEKLSMLTTYLRQEYRYCLWCGHDFADEQDFGRNCPGPTREDHDD